MCAATTGPRNACLLRVLYSSGLRSSEIRMLTAADITRRGEGEKKRLQLTVKGKARRARARVVVSLRC